MKKVVTYVLVLAMAVAMALSLGSVAQAAVGNVSISTSVKVNPATLSGPGNVGVTVTLKNNADPIYGVQLVYPQPTGNTIDLGDMATGATKEHSNNSWYISADMLDKPMQFTINYSVAPGSGVSSGKTESFTIKKQDAVIKVTGSASVDSKEVTSGEKAKFTFNFKNEGNVTIENAYLKAPPLNGGSQLGDNFSLEAGKTKTMTWNEPITSDTTVKPVLTYAVQGKQYTLEVSPVSVSVKSAPSAAAGGAIAVTLSADKSEVAMGDTVKFTLSVSNTGGSSLTNLAATDFDGNPVQLSASSLAKGESATGSTEIDITKTGNYSFSVTAQDADGKPISGQSNALSITVGDAEPSPSGEVDANSILKTDISLLPGTTIEKEGDTIAATITVTNLSDQELKNIVVYDNTIGTLGTQPTLAAGANYTFEKDFTMKQSGDLVFQTSAELPDGQIVQIQTPPVPITVNAQGGGGVSPILIVIIIAIGAVAAFLIWYLLKGKNSKKSGPGGRPAGGRPASYGNGGRPAQRTSAQRPPQQRPPQQRASERDFEEYEEPRYREPQQRQAPRETVEPRVEPPVRRQVNPGGQNGGNGNGGSRFGDRNKF